MTDGMGSFAAPGRPLKTAEDAEELSTCFFWRDKARPGGVLVLVLDFLPSAPSAFSAFFFFRTLASVSASQALLVVLDTARLLCHSAEPASEAIWSSE